MILASNRTTAAKLLANAASGIQLEHYCGERITVPPGGGELGGMICIVSLPLAGLFR